MHALRSPTTTERRETRTQTRTNEERVGGCRSLKGSEVGRECQDLSMVRQTPRGRRNIETRTRGPAPSGRKPADQRRSMSGLSGRWRVELCGNDLHQECFMASVRQVWTADKVCGNRHGGLPLWAGRRRPLASVQTFTPIQAPNPIGLVRLTSLNRPPSDAWRCRESAKKTPSRSPCKRARGRPGPSGGERPQDTEQHWTNRPDRQSPCPICPAGPTPITALKQQWLAWPEELQGYNRVGD